MGSAGSGIGWEASLTSVQVIHPLWRSLNLQDTDICGHLLRVRQEKTDNLHEMLEKDFNSIFSTEVAQEAGDACLRGLTIGIFELSGRKPFFHSSKGVPEYTALFSPTACHGHRRVAGADASISQHLRALVNICWHMLPYAGIC